ncbi:hypothetical protein PAXRUDRAFT_830639 [Paxillus rubicundulus Ve08.2h10]|uniref:Uncharacterized protein n=1 Tax=Paxillus rubicundulus Ve08.2h10 TaxID=930991 RepID=A0A0D0DT67_9AGAM|nr:hypothetical protein PAXRUDRAFT_830639 [Paxillus rubicundulus Ve08.2h10]
MSVPVHAIHTIHGTFSGISSYTSRLAAQSPYPSCAGVVIDVPDRYPPGLAKAAWRGAPTSLSHSPSCRRLQIHLDTRRQRPSPAQPVPLPFPSEDPFDDCNALPVHIAQNDQVIPYQRTRLASQSFTVKLPRAQSWDALVRQRTAHRIAQDRDARCRAVAGILLNRVHAVGKPMRRAPPSADAPRTYKRSRLSSMISVDDL